MHARGGLRNPASRAAITAAVAGAAFAHHHGGLWWRHAHGGFGWVGPVFWPYAYDDFYDYAWWGGDYDPFWDYGYGDLYAGLFGPYDYGALNGYAAYLPESSGATRPAPAARNNTTSTTLADMCGSDSKTTSPASRSSNSATPFKPNQEQAAALDDLANASQKAAELIRNSCPKDVPLTAPSRLAAMQQRVQAMRDAVNTREAGARQVLRAAQRRPEGEDHRAGFGAAHRAARRHQRNGGSCSAAQSTVPQSTTPWPSEQIEREVKPTDAQRASLTALQDATAKAVDILQSSCPPTEARTPPARLDAVGARLDAMLQALGIGAPGARHVLQFAQRRTEGRVRRHRPRAQRPVDGIRRRGRSAPPCSPPPPPSRREHARPGISHDGIVSRAIRSTVIVRHPVRPLAGRMTGSGGRSSIPDTAVIH